MDLPALACVNCEIIFRHPLGSLQRGVNALWRTYLSATSHRGSLDSITALMLREIQELIKIDQAGHHQGNVWY